MTYSASGAVASLWLQLRTLLVGLVGGAAAAAVSMPLPWLTGALLAVCAASLLRLPVRVIKPVRSFAMMVLLTGVGLTFTAAAATAALAQLPLLVFAAVATLGAGILLAPVIAKLGRVDIVTAFFCTVPGGPAEMSMLAEKAGVNGAPVAISQLIRIVSLVVFLPPLMMISGIHGDLLSSATSTLPFDFAGFVLTLALACCAGYGLVRLGLGAGYIVGPLLVGVGLSVSGYALSSVPQPVLWLAQAASGAYLGAQFSRPVLAKLGWFVPTAFASVFLLTLSCTAIALLVAWASGETPGTMILGTAPGSITEMVITASTLGLNTPVVLAFHIARICIVMMLTQPSYRLLSRHLPRFTA